MLHNIDNFRICNARAVSELVIRVFRSSFSPKYTPEGRIAFEQLFAPNEIVARVRSPSAGSCRIARHNGEIVGMIETRPIENGLRIVSLFVETEHHAKGVGSSLVRDVSQKINDGMITVLAAPDAEKAYQKMGFSACDDWKKHKGMLMLPMVNMQPEFPQTRQVLQAE